MLCTQTFGPRSKVNLKYSLRSTVKSLYFIDVLSQIGQGQSKKIYNPEIDAMQ